MAKPSRHRRKYKDRGAGHVHRHLVSCSCGWPGVPFNVKATATAAWEGHVRQETGVAGRKRKAGTAPQPRPVTPSERLPAGW